MTTNNRVYLAILDEVLKKHKKIDKRTLVSYGYSEKMASLLMMIYRKQKRSTE